MSAPLRIPTRYRLALAAKGALLFVLMVVFLGLTAGAIFKPEVHLAIRVVFGAFGAVNAAFLAWTTWLALADVALGQAVQVSGATALPSRKSGVSFRLEGGGSAEYLLVNSWAPAQQGRRYGLTIGRYSHVILDAPRDEGPV